MNRDREAIKDGPIITRINERNLIQPDGVRPLHRAQFTERNFGIVRFFISFRSSKFLEDLVQRIPHGSKLRHLAIKELQTWKQPVTGYRHDAKVWKDIGKIASPDR